MSVNRVFGRQFELLLRLTEHRSSEGNIDAAEIKAMLTAPGAAVIGTAPKIDGGPDPEKAATEIAESLRHGVFAPIESDHVMRHMLLSSADRIDADILRREFGDWNFFEGRNPHINVAALAGLSHPFARLLEMKETGEKKAGALLEKMGGAGKSLPPLSVPLEAGTRDGAGQPDEPANEKDAIARFLNAKTMRL